MFKVICFYALQIKGYAFKGVIQPIELNFHIRILRDINFYIILITR